MEYRTADSRRQFNRWSGRYDRDWLQKTFFEPSHRMLLGELGGDDRRILDVGCGTARLAGRILDCFPDAQVWGLELSDGMIREATRSEAAAGGRLHLVQGDSERLPFAGDTFDAVVCTHCFHHFPRQDRVMAEMFRVVRPGGRVLIIDGDRDRWWGRMIFDVLVVLIEGPVRHLTSGAFRDLYEAAGFREVRHRRRGGPLPFLMTVGHAAKSRPAERRDYRLSA